MSAYSGKCGKGAKRAHQKIKQSEAIERAAAFEQEVARVSREQNIDLLSARWVAGASQRVHRAVISLKLQRLQQGEIQ